MKEIAFFLGLIAFCGACTNAKTTATENALPIDTVAANSLKALSFSVGNYNIKMIFDDNEEKEIVHKNLIYLHGQDTFLTFSGWECQTDTFFISDLNHNGIPESWFFGINDGCLTGIEPKLNDDPKIIALERDEEESLTEENMETYKIQEPFLLRMISTPSLNRADTLRYRLSLDGKLYRSEE